MYMREFSEGEVRNYFINSIKEKANKNKNLLGKLYINLIHMTDSLELNELKGLNDLSLLLDYLDYVQSIKEKQMADSLKQRLDIGYNFALIESKGNQIEFDTLKVESDRSEAKEEEFFKSCGAGSFVFEEYEEPGMDEINQQTSNVFSVASQLLSDDILDDSGGVHEQDQLDSLLQQLEDEVAEEDTGIDSFAELESMLDEINTSAIEDKEEIGVEDGPEKYDFFNDFTNDTDESDDDFDELTGEDEWEDEDLGKGMDMEDSETSFIDTLLAQEETELDIGLDVGTDAEDKDFEEFCDNKLKERWGMFISHIPDWTLEDYESTPLSSIVTLINRGKIELPEDKSLLQEDLIDYFLQQNILKERPVKKESITEEEISTDITDDEEKDIEVLSGLNPSFDFSGLPLMEESREDEQEGNLDKGKQLFKNKTASERVEAADELRKKLGLFGLNKFKSVKGRLSHKDNSNTNEEVINSNTDFMASLDVDDTEDIFGNFDEIKDKDSSDKIDTLVFGLDESDIEDELF